MRPRCISRTLERMTWVRASLLPAVLSALLSACTAPPASNAPTAPPSPSSVTPSAGVMPSASSPSDVTPIPMPSFAQLSAPSRDVVWALVDGRRLFLSTDRGETWEERTAWRGPCCPSREVAFIDDHQGWFADQSVPGTQCSFQSVAIARTNDAAATWNELVPMTLPQSPPGNVLAGRQCKKGLVFADDLRGFITGSDPNSPPVVYRTSDGGRTWSASAPLPDPPGFITRGAGFVLYGGRVHVFGRTLLVAASTSIDGQLTSFAFRSLDGGASWRYVATFPEAGGAVAFASAVRWLQITRSSPGPAMETTDGGATWHQFDSDWSQAAGVPPTIVFADPLVGYATLRGGIRRTIDGGAHWVALKTPGL